MSLFKRKREGGGAVAAAQLRGSGGRGFLMQNAPQPLGGGEVRLYRALREQIPILDAAICKLVRLTGGVRIACTDAQAERELAEFWRTVEIGYGQRGFNAFLDCYLDSLLTCGRAVGEIVPRADGGDIAALVCASVETVEVKGDGALNFTLCSYDEAGRLRELPRQELLLFTPLAPEAERPCGVSLLRSMPAMCGLLDKIYDATGKNWERCGNVRFALVCKNEGEALSLAQAQERAEQVAEAWASAMREGADGRVSDFVSVGDVSIQTIGADNQVLDSEVPVRQILEQLVAKTGLPPFMLGLSWASTERMSSQQADILTSEITALRRTLTPVVERVARLWLRMHGYGCNFSPEWEDIDLQDMVEEARAELYREQARKLKLENDRAERGE